MIAVSDKLIGELLERPVAAVPVDTLDGPTATLDVADLLRRRRLEWVLDVVDQDADVRVIDLARGPAPADPSHRLLVLSDDPLVVLDRRVAGVLPRGSSARQIAVAVAAVAEGLTVRISSPAEAAPHATEIAGLTPREAEILGLVAGGLSNKAIARRLGISAHTVKYHLEAVFAKLGVRSRAEAATQGLRRGLVRL